MIRNSGRAGLVLGAFVALALARPVDIGAQAEVIPGGERRLVTPDLAPDHWMAEAALRAEALGLLERPLPFHRGLSLQLAAAVIEEARLSASGRDPAIARLVEGWRDRFREEFGGIAEGAGGGRGVELLGLRAGGEITSSAGRVVPGYGEVPPNRTGAVRAQDDGWISAEGEAVGALGERAGFLVQAGVGGGGAVVQRMDLVGELGPWTLAVGRQPVGFGKSRPGGIVLTGATALDRVELRTERPAELPGVLEILGPTGMRFFASHVTDDRHAREPYLWGATLSIQPFPRFSVAVHRAAMFGGRGWDQPVTVKTFVDMLIGRVRGLGFENQIVSVEGRYRLPTESTIPLTAYLEWGAEDAAGGWWDVPARVIGIESPALPIDARVSAGAAYTWIPAHCCGNPPWYRHGAFPGNWAAGELPLGHPLGGEGSEWLAYGSLDRSGDGVRVDARLYRRERSGQNLYVPGREGSLGGGLNATWRPDTGLELELGLHGESGDGWNEHELTLGANLFF